MAAKMKPDLTAIDGDIRFLKGTKWVAEGGNMPQWLTVDLGESMAISKVVTLPEFRNVVYGYKIEVSEDNEAWTPFADHSSNRRDRPGEGYTDAGAGRGRYVRITINSAQGNWAALYGFDVYSGEKLVSRGEAGESVILARWRVRSGQRGG
jgi:hypothetical protein